MEEWITKREVLERYGISYGALYRWKRLGLIPEEWFVKRATVTGQETFFKRELICPRVELILQRKESISLEQLAEELADHQQQRRSKRQLVLDDGFKKQTFCVEELKQAVVVDGEQQINILDYLREVLV